MYEACCKGGLMVPTVPWRTIDSKYFMKLPKMLMLLSTKIKIVLNSSG